MNTLQKDQSYRVVLLRDGASQVVHADSLTEVARYLYTTNSESAIITITNQFDHHLGYHSYATRLNRRVDFHLPGGVTIIRRARR